MSHLPDLSSDVMTKNVLIDVPADERLAKQLLSRTALRVSFADPIAEEGPIPRPIQLICDAEILFCSFLPENLSEMRQLELVQLASSGYTQVQGLDLAAKGIRVCNARGVFDTAIAEWNLAMMVCLARNLRGMLRNQERQVWDRSAQFQTEIRGATVGLWGYGGIGRQTARLCKAFGLNVHVLAKSGVKSRLNVFAVADSGDPAGALPDRVFSYSERMQFLSELDFLILCMPLSRETEGIIGVDELKALPCRSYVLNPARGPLIQERALLQALDEGWIAGAALDTHYHYPLPPNHPLWAYENVILTPHISGSSESPFFRQRVWDLFKQNIDRYLAGHALLNELTPDQIDRC
jgi:phosphoglycerate dehydrogenase-like enzyme